MKGSAHRRNDHTHLSGAGWALSPHREIAHLDAENRRSEGEATLKPQGVGLYSLDSWFTCESCESKVEQQQLG